MKAALDELRTRDRVRLNQARRAGNAGALRLADCQRDVAREVGFEHWLHAHHVLGGGARPGEDRGTFWHSPRAGIGPNLWFASAHEALGVLGTLEDGFLLPYRRQCFIVRADFIRELGLDPSDAAWVAVRRDLVTSPVTPDWHALHARRARAPLSTFACR
jgi:hypothetical protein